VEFPSLVAVVEHPTHGVVLLDTGYTERYRAVTRRLPDALYGGLLPAAVPPGETVVAQLDRLGLAPEDVRTVVLTHLHADHVCGLTDLPRARVVLDVPAWRRHTSRRGLARLRRGFLPALLPGDLPGRVVDVAGLATADGAGLEPLPTARDLLGDGSVVVVPLPGHTDGHLGLLVRAHRADVLLVGDAAWSSRAVTDGELPHPVARLVTHDWHAYRATLRALGVLSRRRPELLVVPSHCPDAIAVARARLAG
jgi:glyoxylase-like metal-dependent hydrolase (beta-lactamase superfamily II)